MEAPEQTVRFARQLRRRATPPEHWRRIQTLLDASRDDWCARRGIKALRVEAIDLRDDLVGVVERIAAAARARMT
jgi:very-short-patch-repair endonuclease